MGTFECDRDKVFHIFPSDLITFPPSYHTLYTNTNINTLYIIQTQRVQMFSNVCRFQFSTSNCCISDCLPSEHWTTLNGKKYKKQYHTNTGGADMHFWGWAAWNGEKYNTNSMIVAPTIILTLGIGFSGAFFRIYPGKNRNWIP